MIWSSGWQVRAGAPLRHRPYLAMRVLAAFGCRCRFAPDRQSTLERSFGTLWRGRISLQPSADPVEKHDPAKTFRAGEAEARQARDFNLLNKQATLVFNRTKRAGHRSPIRDMTSDVL